MVISPDNKLAPASTFRVPEIVESGICSRALSERVTVFWMVPSKLEVIVELSSETLSI
jgi:hypothetical protein